MENAGREKNNTWKNKRTQWPWGGHLWECTVKCFWMKQSKRYREHRSRGSSHICRGISAGGEIMLKRNDLVFTAKAGNYYTAGRNFIFHCTWHFFCVIPPCGYLFSFVWLIYYLFPFILFDKWFDWSHDLVGSAPSRIRIPSSSLLPMACEGIAFIVAMTAARKTQGNKTGDPR